MLWALKNECLAGDASVRNNDIGTKVRVGRGGKVEVAKIESQTAKSKVMIFC